MANLIEKEAAKLEEELINALAECIDPNLALYDEEKARIFTELSKIEGIQEFWRAVMAQDMRLYFQAGSDKERDAIRGAYSRVAWVRAGIKNVKVKKDLDASVAKRTA